MGADLIRYDLLVQDALRSVVKKVLTDASHITVTVVPVILGTSPLLGRPDDVIQYRRVRIVTYR